MTHPWPELVRRLEEITLEPYFQDPDGLLAAVEDRRQIIEQLASADANLLEPTLRDELFARLLAVQERDRATMTALVALRESTREELTKSNTGMRAMNGYKSTVNSEPPPVRRIG
ncbi:MAG TPA: flagellar protein FliT [Polyangiales bacterium]